MTPGTSLASRIVTILVAMAVYIFMVVFVRSPWAVLVGIFIFMVVWILVLALRWTPDFSKLRLRRRGE